MSFFYSTVGEWKVWGSGSKQLENKFNTVSHVLYTSSPIIDFCLLDRRYKSGQMHRFFIWPGKDRLVGRGRERERKRREEKQIVVKLSIISYYSLVPRPSMPGLGVRLIILGPV